MINAIIATTVSLIVSYIIFMVSIFMMMNNKRFIKWYYKKMMDVMTKCMDLKYDDEEY